MYSAVSQKSLSVPVFLNNEMAVLLQIAIVLVLHACDLKSSQSFTSSVMKRFVAEAADIMNTSHSLHPSSHSPPYLQCWDGLSYSNIGDLSLPIVVECKWINVVKLLVGTA